MDRLALIKRRHTLVCEAMDTLNDCFGYTLLLSFMFFFINNINSAFYIFGDTTEGISLIDLLFSIEGVFHLIVVCCAADFITDQV